jgi:exosortase A-associated hydrolase 1
MGDSTGTPRSFESISADITAAIDAVQQHVPQVKRVVLWGLCDGASAALLYVHETGDRRVCGMCLANPWVRSELSLARTHVKHYYGRRLMQREFWAKLFRGRVGNEAFATMVRNLRTSMRGQTSSTQSRTEFQQRMVAGWSRLQGSILLLLSGEDYTAKEFAEYAAAEASWREALSSPRLKRGDLPGADHTLSRSIDRRRAEDLTLGWLATLRRAEDAVPKASVQHR